MKKIIAVGLVILLSLSACAKQPKPEDVLINFLKDYKTLETLDYTDYFDGENPLVSQSDLVDETFDAIIQDKIKSVYKHYKYRINETTLSTDSTTAIVDITITNYDGLTLYSDWFKTYLTKAMELAISKPNMTEADFQTFAATSFGDAIDALVDGREFDVEVKMKLVDKVWKLNGGDDNFDLINAMSGGILQSIQDFADSQKK